jgi:replicative DNA helicase
MSEHTINTMPHAPLAEKSILSAMFRDPSTIARAAAEGIGADAFHLPAHRSIFARLIKQRDAGHLTDEGEIDLGTFVQAAHLAGELDGMGGPAEIYAVSSHSIGMAGWSAWCEHVREAKARRIAVDASEALASAGDSEEAIRAATEALEAMRTAISAKTRAMTAKQAANDFIERYIAASEAGEMPGDTTGIYEIDAVTGGMRSGELWTVCGKSSSGKSVLMFQIASEFVTSGKPVAVFSLEMMAHEIVGRLVTLAARVGHDTITKPQQSKVTQGDLKAIKAAVEALRQSKFWIDATAGQTLETIAGEAERIRDIEGGLSLIVVDYLQIVSGARGRNESREQEIARVSGGLKQLAKKMGCPVITGSQLNEQGQTRESRAIENDSDTMLVIEDNGILLKKVRNGKRGDSINLALDGKAQRFRHFTRN